MMAQSSFLFPPFHFDSEAEQLRREEQRIPLRPKAVAVLSYLIVNNERVVPKAELLKSVWPDTVVTEAVLKVCIQEIRKALGDAADKPQYIETVPRKGYQFIAPVVAFAAPISSAKVSVQSFSPHPIPNTQHPAPPLVGRDAELARLHDWLEQARQGQRRIVFATGEPGIGKTSLVEAFLARIAADPTVWIARGQCIEHYGASEPCLPILEGIERLCQEPGHERLIPLLRQYAPLWLAQLPAVLNQAERIALHQETQGATPERRLRELATLVEALTQDSESRASLLLVLFVEDLQWSDYSTLDVLTTLARRRAQARLLVIGTYRPADVLLNEHPLRHVTQELCAHKQCAELTLTGLSAVDVEVYLYARFPQSAFPTHLAQVLQQRTGGNPLFLLNLIEALLSERLLVQAEGRWALQGGVAALSSHIPESSRYVLEKQSARLGVQEQQVLAAASIAGAEFSAAAVAAVLGTTVSEVETCCEALVQQQRFLQPAGLSEWPDGTVAARYRFRHALYQQLWHERVTPSQGLLWHRRIGECIENAYGNRVREVSTELAMHFEQARDYQRAVRFLQLAGEKALRQCAYREATGLLSQAIELLHALSDSPERARQELALRVALSEPLAVLYGFAAPQVEQSYVQAQALCAQIGDSPHLFPVLQGLASLYAVRAEFLKARKLQEQLLHEAEKAQTPELLFRAHRTLAVTRMALGEFAAARTHLEQSLALQSMRQQSAGRLLDDYAWIASMAYEALVLGMLGYPDQARQRSTEALTQARQSGQPFSRAATCIQAALLSICLQETRLTQQLAEEGLVTAHEENLARLVALGTFYQGWGLDAQGQTQDGIAQMRQGLTALRAIKAIWYQSYFLALLAEVYGKEGDIEEGCSVLREAFALPESTGERFAEAELYRIKRHLALQKFQVSSAKFQVPPNPQHLAPSTPAEAEAEACFQKAIAIAHQQSARLWELRAAMSLGRLWRQQGKSHEARHLLAGIYGWFTEGFATKDLQEARTLLSELE